MSKWMELIEEKYGQGTLRDNKGNSNMVSYRYQVRQHKWSRPSLNGVQEDGVGTCEINGEIPFQGVGLWAYEFTSDPTKKYTLETDDGLILSVSFTSIDSASRLSSFKATLNP